MKELFSRKQKNNMKPLFIILSVIVCILVVILLRYSPQNKPKPAPKVEQDPAKAAIEKLIPNIKWDRTDKITSKLPVVLLNAKPQEYYNVFLQKWDIVPPKELNQASDVIWASFNKTGVQALDFLANTYGYSVTEESGKIKFSKSPNLALSPVPKDIEQLELPGYKLGEALWNLLNQEKKEFLVCLPITTSSKPPSKTTLKEALEANNLVAGLNQSGVILIYEKRETNSN